MPASAVTIFPYLRQVVKSLTLMDGLRPRGQVMVSYWKEYSHDCQEAAPVTVHM
jgi:hypothetical protein